MIKNEILLSVIMVVIISNGVILSSCSKSNPKVQPEVLTSLNNEVIQSDRMSQSSLESDPEVFSLYIRVTDHMHPIADACGYYCDGYGVMPESLVDILPEFLFVWPQGVFSDNPIKILSVIPDPGDPDHSKDSVFYERIDDLKANIHFLMVDLENSTSDSIVWELATYEIYSNWAKYLLADETRKMAYMHIGGQLANMEPEVRIKRCYRQSVAQVLAGVINYSIKRKNTKLEESFVEMLENGGFFVMDESYNHLKNAISENVVYFNVSTFGNEGWVYFDHGEVDYISQFDCYRSVKKDNHFDWEFYKEPLDDTIEKTSHIESKDFVSYVIPQSRILSIEDIVIE